MDLEDIAGRLYGLFPESFTEARDEAVREARGAGDRELARRVQALRRPTASAALVNGLRSGDPALLEQLLALGPELARAQSEGAGETLRELSGQRRAVLQAVVSRAVELSERAVTAPVRAEVEGTFEAALADPTSAEAVRSGRLVRALSYAGFGGVDLADAVALPERPPRPARPAASASRRRQAAHGGQARAGQAPAEQARAGQARAEAVAAAPRLRPTRPPAVSTTPYGRARPPMANAQPLPRPSPTRTRRSPPPSRLWRTPAGGVRRRSAPRGPRPPRPSGPRAGRQPPRRPPSRPGRPWTPSAAAEPRRSTATKVIVSAGEVRRARRGTR